MYVWGGTGETAAFAARVGSGGSWGGGSRRTFAVDTAGDTAGDRVPVDTWTHLAFVLVTDSADSTGYVAGKLFVNGVDQPVSLDGTGDISGGIVHNTTASPAIIGNSWVGDDEFDGELDEIRVYSRALSDDEIKALYDFEAPGFQ